VEEWWWRNQSKTLSPGSQRAARPNLKHRSRTRCQNSYPVITWCWDFFLAEVLDCAIKDDRHSMEHPIFSLSKKKDIRVRFYKHNGIKITITPSAKGLATI
jgi:plasmid replication initiation protein